MRTDLTSLLFPTPAREFRGQRWVNIGLRCVHLVGMAGVAGGFLFDLAPTQWSAYWYLTLASGIALSLLYIWSSLVWLLELKGLTIIIKLLLLFFGSLVEDARVAVFIVLVVLSGVVAHAPGQIRSWRWLEKPANTE